MTDSRENSTIIDDLKDERVPQALQWSTEQVADWVEQIGYPFYKECFSSNCITGRRLLLMDASALPEVGIHDFEHIKDICQKIRKLLSIEDPYWNRSISLPPLENLGLYLQRKCATGEKANALTYAKFLMDNEENKWQPPLCNQALIIPHD